MQSVWSRIWTRVAVSIFYDDNHYTMGTSSQSMIVRNSMEMIKDKLSMKFKLLSPLHWRSLINTPAALLSYWGIGLQKPKPNHWNTFFCSVNSLKIEYTICITCREVRSPLQTHQNRVPLVWHEAVSSDEISFRLYKFLFI